LILLEVFSILVHADGVAKRAKIHPVKVLDDNGAGSYSAVIAGMRWAKNAAKSNRWKGVVTLSLGGPRSRSMDDVVAELVSAGLTVVVAAGNEFGANACNTSPAGAPPALTVGSSTRSDAKSSFSNVGSCLDIWAPGEDLFFLV
jgi:subtilisin family serine protease